MPHRYPEIAPEAPTTRWQGMPTATGFVAHARATARAAPGRPMSDAISPYDRVSPCGIAACASAPIGGGRHSQLRRRPFVKAAAGSVARREHRPRHIVTAAQAPPDRPQPAGFGVRARRDAGDPLEVALEMIGTAAESGREP